ncbi:MAG: GNAT family N-acetyltransferase [Sulfolobales archaeon]
MEVKKAGGVFYIKLEDSSKAYVATETEGSVLKILETYVPESHRGRGYARVLVEKVVDYAKSNGLKVLPICSYAISYFMKNKEARDVLVEEWRGITEDEWKNRYEKRLIEEAKKKLA